MTSRPESSRGRRICEWGAWQLWGTLVAAGILGCGSVDESSGLIGSRSSAQVAINELVSSGGIPTDWIELYNLGEEAVNLAGFFMSDDPDDPADTRLGEEVEIPGHGVIVLQADSRAVAAGEPLAVDFGLSASGETLVLTDAQGLMVDSVSFAASSGGSFARHPDGTGSLSWCEVPTPGELNGAVCGG